MQEKVAWGDTWARSTWHLNTDGLHIHCSFVHLKQDRFYFAGFPLFVFLNSKQYRMTSVKILMRILKHLWFGHKPSWTWYLGRSVSTQISTQALCLNDQAYNCLIHLSSCIIVMHYASSIIHHASCMMYHHAWLQLVQRCLGWVSASGAARKEFMNSTVRKAYSMIHASSRITCKL